MSGFAAVLMMDATPVDSPEVQRIQEILGYRGRDASGVFTDSRAVLIQTLNLLIPNKPLPKLPLTLEDCIIVGDVRLDGRNDLIERLRIAGRKVEIEVIDEALVLFAYLAFGQSCVDYLMGDFSFAIWDSDAKTLFAARDQIGRRNLYYTRTQNSVLISNEIRSLKDYPSVVPDLDHLYVADFLMLGEGFWIDKSSTPFRSIQRLKRGHTLLFKDRQIRCQQYWSLPPDRPLLRYRREEEYVEHFRSVFREAVKDRLRSDRVIITLSGGMDSSTSAATAFDLIHHGEVNTHATAVTGIYSAIDDPEESYARETAHFLGISERHYIYNVQRYYLLRPYVHTSNAIRQNLTPRNWIEFQRFLASHGRVALYAYLGDTLVSDLPIASSIRRMNPIAFAAAYRRLWQYFDKRPALGSGLLARISRKQSDGLIPYSLPPWINPDFQRQYSLQERWDDYWSWVARIGQSARNPYLFRTLENYDYYSHDESSAFDFTPIENVDPFADLRVLDFLASLPPLPWFRQKYLLRRMMSGRLPPSVLSRPKQIFGDVVAHLLSLPENVWVDDWRPTKELEPYVVWVRVPKIAGEFSRIGASQAVHLRPLTLDLWLNTERGDPIVPTIS